MDGRISSTHPELRPWFLQGFSRRVQCPPFIRQLSSSPLPPLQKQCGPHHVEECKHHAADVTAGLRRPRITNTPKTDASDLALSCCIFFHSYPIYFFRLVFNNYTMNWKAVLYREHRSTGIGDWHYVVLY